MKIHAVDVRTPSSDVLTEIEPEFMGGPDSLDRLMGESDFLSLHLPLTKRTEHIIDARRIGLMKPTAVLINVARGKLVDEESLHQALLTGKLGGAGIDVYTTEPPDPDLPVYQLPNVVTTSHIAGSTEETSGRRGQMAADNLKRYAERRDLQGQVVRDK